MKNLHPAVEKLLDETKGLNRDERLAALEGALKEAIAIRKLNVMESISFSFGGAGLNAFNVEHPGYDSGNYPWTAVTGISGAYNPSKGFSLLSSELALEEARNTCRRLAAENEFAVGAHRLRKSYIMGNGIKWFASPMDLEKENEKLTKRANDSILAFLDDNLWHLMEREIVHRVDRDGECFLRTFLNGKGKPLQVRFIEPELIRTPGRLTSDPVKAAKALFGVQMGGKNDAEVVGYWVHRHEQDDNPQFVRKMQPNAPDIPQIIHIKGNTDMDQRRGWPIMWPGRKNLDRAEKLLRNMSVVATLQAAIAVVRKHESATKADVSSFLQDTEDFNWTDQISGERQSAKGIGGDMGLVLDAGPGFSYETPISSVNASVNVEVLRAELRSCAAMLNMPESMFTSQLDGSFAGALVSEAPFVKYMEGEQLFFGSYLKPVIEAHIAHEVMMRRLPPKVQKGYRVKPEFTSLEVRDFLKEAQMRQLQADAKVLSKTTWRALAGYDEAIEKRNLEREHEDAIKKAQEMPLMQPGNGPSADNGQNDGKGGADQQPKPGSNKDAPDSNFAQDDAQSLMEALMGGTRSPIEIIKSLAPGSLGSSSKSKFVTEMLSILLDRLMSDQEKVRLAVEAVVNFAPKLKPLLGPNISTDEMDAIADVYRTFGHIIGKDRDTGLALSVLGVLMSGQIDKRDKITRVMRILSGPAASVGSGGGDAGGEIAPGVPA